ncbi:MAG TPA: hypothetical protein VEI02_08825, partial [Planctomycetota bacterium]|nr:hypothetical protein [Planctomycetota bacterium]
MAPPARLGKDGRRARENRTAARFRPLFAGFALIAAWSAAQSPLRRLEESFPEAAPEAFGDVDGDGDVDAIVFGAVAVND